MCRLFKSSVKYIVKSDALKSVFCLAGISLVGLFTKEVWQKVWTFGAYTSKCWNVGLYDLSRTKHFSHIKKKKVANPINVQVLQSIPSPQLLGQHSDNRHCKGSSFFV